MDIFHITLDVCKSTSLDRNVIFTGHMFNNHLDVSMDFNPNLSDGRVDASSLVISSNILKPRKLKRSEFHLRRLRNT